MKQIEKIIEVLKEKGVIDNHFCIDNRWTTRLGACIYKLKKRGWDFKPIMKGKNCYYYVTKSPFQVEEKKQEVVDKTISMFV